MITNSPREPIFDDHPRLDPSPSKHGESTFAFLDRIAGSFWNQPRELMQAWASVIDSDTEYQDLRQRFRSRDDGQFHSAFLELFLHETFIRAGYHLEIHPTVPGSRRRPDVLVVRGDERFYVEAIVPTGSKVSHGPAAREAALFDAINTIPDPNFYLIVDELTVGPRFPRTKAAKRHIE